ncbi:MAG: Holliday junction resolvase RuvX [Pirellulales bacterium]
MTESQANPPADDPRGEPSIPPGKVAGIDYGTVRIGVAVSNSSRTIASPLETYTRRGAKRDADYFRELAGEEQIACFVIGLPVHLNGEESQKSFEAREFGKWLHAETGVAIAYYDERFSTAQADELLAAGKLTKKRRKARRDMLAAQIMLASFLESGATSRPDPGSIG